MSSECAMIVSVRAMFSAKLMVGSIVNTTIIQGVGDVEREPHPRRRGKPIMLCKTGAN